MHVTVCVYVPSMPSQCKGDQSKQPSKSDLLFANPLPWVKIVALLARTKKYSSSRVIGMVVINRLKKNVTVLLEQ